MKQVVLLMAHFYNKSILEKLEKLKTELDGSVYDIVLLLNDEVGLRIEDSGNNDVFRFSALDLNVLGYEPIEETLIT